jgi:hypothetical protein
VKQSWKSARSRRQNSIPLESGINQSVMTRLGRCFANELQPLVAGLGVENRVTVRRKCVFHQFPRDERIIHDKDLESLFERRSLFVSNALCAVTGI